MSEAVQEVTEVDESITEETQLSDIQVAHYKLILELESEYKDLEEQHLLAKEKATKAKKRAEVAEAELLATIARGPNRQREIQFDDSDGDEKQDYDDLMKVSIFDALTDLTKSQRERMEELKIVTVHDFELLRGGQLREYPRGLLDVKGWGDAAITKMENAILEWLAANQQPLQQVDPENPEEWIEIDANGDNVDASDDLSEETDSVYSDLEADTEYENAE